MRDIILTRGKDERRGRDTNNNREREGRRMAETENTSNEWHKQNARE